MNPDDAQLVKETILGKQGSFDELVHRYTHPIYNFSYRLTGNTQTAEDITQETFIKVWKNINRYNSNHSFKSWIFTIARNTITDHLRKKKTIPFSNLSSHEEFAFEDSLPDEEILPPDIFAKIEDRKLLEKLLEKVPEEYKTVLILHYQEGLTFEEIGTILKKPSNTVKSWHRRSLIKLRELINQELHETN